MTKDNTSEISFEFPAFEFQAKQEQFNFKAPMKRIHKENKQNSQQIVKLISELHEITKQIKVEQMMRRRQIMAVKRFVLFK